MSLNKSIKPELSRDFFKLEQFKVIYIVYGNHDLIFAVILCFQVLDMMILFKT